jgi:two-component system, OmpR family, response regulator
MTTDAIKILVVDDDLAIRTLITRFLKQKGYQITEANTGASALETFATFHPDLVILDVNLPDSTGYALCEQMQSQTDVFVLMLTSRGDLSDKITGFSKGADDYLTKPFNLEELEFRVSALLKRLRSPVSSPQQAIAIGDLTINSIQREVYIQSHQVILTALEFDLLYFLACHPKKVWRREELIQQVWDYEFVGDERVVDVHIGQIRRKLQKLNIDSSFIQTVRGVGYKFEYEATPSA